ncbi:MAG: S8 family serine peptidase [Nevskiaceae bacterium]
MQKCERWSRILLIGGALLGLAPLNATEPAKETWIVTYDAPPTAAQVETLTGIASGVHGYQHLPAAVAVISPGASGLLANLPGVRGVYPDRQMEWLLDESTRAIRADGVWADGYTGAGIGVAVVDAGVDGTHPDLCAAIEFCNGTGIKTVQNVKIVGDQEKADPVVVVENQISTDSSSGHGSHVAGIAAGAGTASETPGRYRGVAHGARLIGLGTGEVASVTTVLAAFDWILANHSNPAYNIKVVNNSWGPGAGAQYDPEEPVQRGIGAMHDAGITVVFGAGNDGPRTGTINIFGANPKAISAAASTKSDHIALFSSRGAPGHSLLRPTVTTPGMFIASVRARTGFYAWGADATGPDFNDPILPPDDVSYAYASGTSMSSPHVAGVVALLQESAIANLGRYLTPAEVRNLLQNTAVSNEGSAPGLPNYQGYTMGAGLVDALAAVRSVAAGTNLQAYDDNMAEDVRTFKGTILANSSFETTYTVAPGAVSLDVMIDWGSAAQDLDLDLYRPDGSLYLSTVLYLGLSEGPNQYSSAFTNQPNERINVNSPQAGTWRAVVKGTSGASDTVFGAWSGVYPDGTALAPPQSAAAVAVAAPATPGVAGNKVNLTATVTDASGFPVSNATVNWTSAGVGAVVTAETLTDERGTALATVNADSVGTQTVTATVGAASGSATVLWVGLPQVTLPPPPASTPGRMSGGGHISNPSKKHFAFFAEYTAQSSAPGGELSFDDKNGMKVQATALASLTVSGNAATLKGEASVNGVGGYTFTLDVVDNGEPGANDTFRLRLTQPANPLYGYDTTATALSGGNVKVQAY